MYIICLVRSMNECEINIAWEIFTFRYQFAHVAFVHIILGDLHGSFCILHTILLRILTYLDPFAIYVDI